jgi:hypothetical protein
MLDLWPNDISVDAVTIKSPVNILREQAAVLAQKTQNIVKVRVAPYERPVSNLSREDSMKYAIDLGYLDPETAMEMEFRPTEPLDMPNKQFQYGFELVAPILDNYSYLLFAIFHDVDFYPIRIMLAKSLQEDEKSREMLVKTEEEFLKILGDIFNAPKTKEIIRALIAQSTTFPNQ